MVHESSAFGQVHWGSEVMDQEGSRGHAGATEERMEKGDRDRDVKVGRTP